MVECEVVECEMVECEVVDQRPTHILLMWSIVCSLCLVFAFPLGGVAQKGKPLLWAYAHNKANQRFPLEMQTMSEVTECSSVALKSCLFVDLFQYFTPCVAFVLCLLFFIFALLSLFLFLEIF